MLKTTSALLLLLFAATLQAQIFPRIEKEDVKQRIASGSTEPEPEIEEPDKPEKPKEVDGATVLKRYNEILDGMLKEQRAQKKDMTKHVAELHPSVHDYLEGIFLLRMGFYEDADRKLKGVGTDVRNESELKNDTLKQMADDIKSGKAIFFRMKAVVLQNYQSYDTEADALEGWRKAAAAGVAVRKELNELKDADKLTGKQDISAQITAWLLTARIEWLDLYRAEKATRDEPGRINSWLDLISATGSKQNMLKDEYTPHFLKQRAALMVVKEFWPDSGYVKGAAADVTLAINKVGCGQLDEWESHLEKKEYHTPGGLIVLESGRKMAGEYNRAFEAMKNN